MIWVLWWRDDDGRLGWYDVWDAEKATKEEVEEYRLQVERTHGFRTYATLNTCPA